MTTSLTTASVSRRTALAVRHTDAQDATPETMATYPIVGVWNVKATPGPNVAVFFADGTAIFALPTSSAGPQGVQFVSALVGTWEPVSARGVHFTSVQQISDANGTYTGSATVDGHPVVSEDGQTLLDDAPETTVTIRDAAGAIVTVVPGSQTTPNATAIRMGVGTPGFPEGTPTAGTPARHAG